MVPSRVILPAEGNKKWQTDLASFFCSFFTEKAVNSRFANELPDDLIRYVFKYLNPVELNYCCQVNHHWRKNGVDNDVWIEVAGRMNFTCIQNENIRDQMLTHIISDRDLKYQISQFLWDVDIKGVLQKKCHYLFMCCYPYGLDEPSVHLSIRHKDCTRRVSCKSLILKTFAPFDRRTFNWGRSGFCDNHNHVMNRIGMKRSIEQSFNMRKFSLNGHSGYLKNLHVEFVIKMNGSAANDQILSDNHRVYELEGDFRNHSLIDVCQRQYGVCNLEERWKKQQVFLMKCALSIGAFVIGVFMAIASHRSVTEKHL